VWEIPAFSFRLCTDCVILYSGLWTWSGVNEEILPLLLIMLIMLIMHLCESVCFPHCTDEPNCLRCIAGNSQFQFQMVNNEWNVMHNVHC